MFTRFCMLICTGIRFLALHSFSPTCTKSIFFFDFVVVFVRLTMDEYLRACFCELFKDDGLTVLGRGLGLEALFGKFLRLYAEQPINQRRDLVLCLNAYGKEQCIRSTILSDGGHPETLPKIISNEVTPQERVEMYEEGGCYFITTRILIVDLLDQTLDPMRISGLLIYDAHRISETSIESFVIRVFRDNNRMGFIKGFSEDPELLQGGFSKIERIMRTLFLKKLYLWPRFRLEVAQALENHSQPEVVELKMSLTPNMRAIQNAILVCLNTCLTELKKACPNLEAEQMTLENGLFGSFDYMIRSQLDPEWHRVSFRTKSIINDLGVLRKLLDYLIRYDAFSFYYLLLKLQATSSSQTSPALWLTMDAANMIFQHAKARVHQMLPLHKSKVAFCQNTEIKQLLSTLKLESILHPVLECPPKWTALMQIMDEIRTEYLKRKENIQNMSSTSSENQSMKNQLTNAGRILLIARDELSASQLRDCLIHGTKYVMDIRYRWFVSQQCAEIRRKGPRIPRNSSSSFASSSFLANKSSSFTLKKAGNASSVLPVSSSDMVGGSNNPDEKVHELFSERNVVELLRPQLQRGDGSLIAKNSNCNFFEEAVDVSTGGFLDLGINETYFKQLSPETQSLLIQEKILRNTPAILSRQKPWKCLLITGENASSNLDQSTINKGSKMYMPKNDSEFDLEDNNKLNERSYANDDDGNIIDLFQDDLPNKDNERGEESISRKRKSFEKESSQIDNKKKKMSTSRNSSKSNLSYLDAKDEEEICITASAFVTNDLMVHVVTHHQLRENWSLLRDFQPSTVLLYDADVRIVRQIEVYQSTMPDTRPPVRVYFFAYEGSAEEHRYVATLAKEKKAFESLILTKEHLVISLPDNPFDIQQAKSLDASLTLDSRSINNNNNAATAMKKKKVAVDVREFRSSLPSLLHISQQWQVVPRTIQIGDYILSPEICVERKGISDLFQSFASGRLYNQVESMSRYYRYPVLLIEFQPDKPFCLTTAGDIPTDISSNAITSKLVLLAQSFPQLKIVWSRSPQHTVEIFRTIAAKHEEADIDKAMTVGSAADNSGHPAMTHHASDSGLQELRLAAQEMLLSLPGINAHNFRDVMHHVENLAELSKLSEAELVPIIGPVNARKLREFFTQRTTF